MVMIQDCAELNCAMLLGGTYDAVANHSSSAETFALFIADSECRMQKRIQVQGGILHLPYRTCKMHALFRTKTSSVKVACTTLCKGSLTMHYCGQDAHSDRMHIRSGADR